ncbi:MAG: Omp28 family outer membrane lipoprotein [Owenweeksia sp.]
MKKLIVCSFLFSAALMSCNKIDQPLKNEYGFAPLPDSSSKVVLLEEFTGTSCNNCPEAAEKARELYETFPGQVVLLAIHAGGFSIPNDKHPQDFRTQTGNDIYNFFRPQGVPSGMFDRSGHPDPGAPLFPSKWDAAIVEELNKPAVLALTPAFNFDETKKELNLRTEIVATSNLPEGDYFFSAFVYEDSIVAPQTLEDGVSIDYDYVHMHMLRGSFTGNSFGESVVEGTLNNGAAYAKAYTIKADEKWNPEHLGAVFFLYDRNTYEIIQAGSAHLHK